MENTIFITGTSRGIGLEFVKQYAENKWHVYASARQISESLANLAKKYNNIHLIEFDVTDFKSYQNIANQLKDIPIDIILNNAGIYGKQNQEIGNLEPENFHAVYTTNTIAPVMVVQNLLPNLEKGKLKLIVNISSRMGCIGENNTGDDYAYRSSKSALNSIMKSLQTDVQDKGIKVLLLHPGWVKTDMGGQDAYIDTNTSVTGMCKVIEQARSLKDLFYNYEGKALSW